MRTNNMQGMVSAMTRRKLLGLMTKVAATLYATSASKAATAAPQRTIIDVHAHFLPDFYRQALADAGLKTLDGGMPIPRWSRELALETMDRHGITTALLSVSSPGLTFVEPAREATLARAINEHAAILKREHQDRFGGFACLPLSNVTASLKEIDHALDTLQLDGFILETNHRGRYPSHAEFTPVYAALNERKALVFMHPTSPACLQCLGPRPAPLIEFPFDTTRAAVDMLYSGMLDRYPNIRFILSHAGGTLPYLADRIAGFATVPNLDPKPPSPEVIRRQLQRFYFDIALSSGAAPMSALLKTVPASQVLFGSDWPFSPEITLMQALDNLSAADHPAHSYLEAILHGNAQGLLASDDSAA